MVPGISDMECPAEGAFGPLVRFIVEQENLSAEEKRALAELLHEESEQEQEQGCHQ